MGWRNVTEECEVLDGRVEVSLFVSVFPGDDCEVYFSFDIFFNMDMDGLLGL